MIVQDSWVALFDDGLVFKHFLLQNLIQKKNLLVYNHARVYASYQWFHLYR